MCSSSSTRQNEQKPTAAPARVPRQEAERDAGVLQLREVHLARPRVGERRLLDRQHVVDVAARQRLDDPGTHVGASVSFDAPAAYVVFRLSRLRRRAAARRAAAPRPGRAPRRARSTASRPIAPASSGCGRTRIAADIARDVVPRTAPRRRRRRPRLSPPISVRQRSSVAAGVPTVGPSISTSRCRLNGAAGATRYSAREHVAAVRVHPRRDHARLPADRRSPTCASASSADTPTIAPAVHEREPLNRRDADPQAGERSRARRDGEQIDRRPAASWFASASATISPGSRSRVRARAVAAALVDDAIVVDERDASRARRRVEGQHSHRQMASSISRIGLLKACTTGKHMSASVTPAMRQYLDAKAAASRRHPALPDGRLLRDVLRGRAGRRARARADADLAVEGRQRRRHPDVRRARFTPSTATSRGW